MCMCSCHCLSYPVSLSRSLLDATTPNTTDRLRVISLSPLTHTQIFICVQPSQSTVWHQQSCATRTRPCGDFRDLEKMSQIFFLTGRCSSLSHGRCNILQRLLKRHNNFNLFELHCDFWYGKIHFRHPHSAITL